MLPPSIAVWWLLCAWNLEIQQTRFVLHELFSSSQHHCWYCYASMLATFEIVEEHWWVMTWPDVLWTPSRKARVSTKFDIFVILMVSWNGMGGGACIFFFVCICRTSLWKCDRWEERAIFERTGWGFSSRTDPKESGGRTGGEGVDCDRELCRAWSWVSGWGREKMVENTMKGREEETTPYTGSRVYSCGTGLGRACKCFISWSESWQSNVTGCSRDL